MSGSMNMKISIVTVCLNAEKTIAPTIESVVSQDYRNFEHVIIDGGSTDKTLNILSRFPHLQIHSGPDAGIYDAMDKSRKLISGDAAFFLNSGDSFVDASVLKDVVAAFQRTKADAIFGDLLPVTNESDAYDHPAFINGKVLDLSYFWNRSWFFTESIHHQTIFYSKAILEACSYLCENPAANGEYHLNLQAFVEKGFTLKHVRRPICRFLLGGESTKDFAKEWARYVVARDYLRDKFFQSVPPRSYPMFEYVSGLPSTRSMVKNALKVLSR
jgi:glycosyltransferase involved in cell wall biosynthesis